MASFQCTALQSLQSPIAPPFVKQVEMTSQAVTKPEIVPDKGDKRCIAPLLGATPVRRKETRSGANTDDRERDNLGHVSADPCVNNSRLCHVVGGHKSFVHPVAATAIYLPSMCAGYVPRSIWLNVDFTGVVSMVRAGNMLFGK